MSTAMRFTLAMIFAPMLFVAASLAQTAEQPAAGARDPGTLPKEATAAGPAVDTSKTDASQSSTDAEQPSAQRSEGPRAVVRNDRLNMDSTVLTGNRELPKVLYIVPWKKSDLGELPAQPFNTLLDEALTPIDRDVFRREVTYYDAIAAGGAEGAEAARPQPERTEK